MKKFIMKFGFCPLELVMEDNFPRRLTRRRARMFRSNTYYELVRDGICIRWEE